VKAYWFSNDDGTTAHQKTPAVVGRTDTFDGTPIPCECGLHASPTPWDALQYACGGRLWEVEIPDDSIPHGIPHGIPLDKYAARSRTYLRSVDLRHVLVEFSCRQADGVLHIYEKLRPNDARPRKAIEAARAYERGEITRAQLDAAWAAARAAAGDAAGDAAWDAARDAAGAAARAAARDAAWDAARDAAGAAARAAARDAARDAAGAAAWAAARDAAWAAAGDAAGEMFNGMARGALEEA
jgi:hypothetical protein